MSPAALTALLRHSDPLPLEWRAWSIAQRLAADSWPLDGQPCLTDDDDEWWTR